MSAFEESYARLQKAFRARCATEGAELRELAAAGRLRDARSVALLHRMAGAAGTFGFDRLSVEAARLEETVRARGDGHGDPAPLFSALDLVVGTGGLVPS